MYHTKMCRVCLNSDDDTTFYEDEKLSQLYFQLIGLKMPNSEAIQFCMTCIYYLNGFLKFKNKCITTHKLLQNIISSKGKLNKSTIKALNQSHKLNYTNINNHTIINIKHNSKKRNKLKNKLKSNQKIPVVHFDLNEDLDFNSDSDIVLNELSSRDDYDFYEANNILIDKCEDMVVKEKKRMEEQNLVIDNLDKVTTNKTREDLEMKRKIDKRFKKPTDLQNEFKIDVFLTLEEQRKEFETKKYCTNYIEAKLKCEKCFKGFREQKLWDLHNLKHEEGSGDYVCQICYIRLATSKRYRTHRDGNHTSKFSCNRCDFLTYSKAQARNHLLWHQGVQHSCPHCNMTFRKYTTLMGHLRLLHPSDHICGSCAHSFVSAHGLKHHIKLVHKENKKSADATSCKECDVTFDTYKIYIKHILICPKHKDMAKNIIGCGVCGEEFSNKDIMSNHKHRKTEAEREEDKNRRYICPQCDQQFPHPTSVYQHFVKSHPNIPYKVGRMRKHCLCEWCGKTFMCKSKLVAHKRLHTGETPYNCTICPKSFRTKLYLTKHLNSHNGIKKHNCKICTKTFSNSGNLFKHMRIHSGVKPFKCDICSKAFVDSSNLRQHVQGVHFNVRRTRKP